MADKIITEKDVEYVARLARIDVPDTDKKKYQGQLETILEYIAKLQAVKTDSIKPTAHPHAVSNVWREDEARPFAREKDIFKNAAEMEETFYKVKKVIE